MRIRPVTRRRRLAGGSLVAALALLLPTGPAVIDAAAGTPATLAAITLSGPTAVSEPNAATDWTGHLTVSGASQPQKRVDLVVDGARYATVTTGKGGIYLAQISFRPGAHDVQAIGRPGNPLEVRSSIVHVTVGSTPPTPTPSPTTTSPEPSPSTTSPEPSPSTTSPEPSPSTTSAQPTPTPTTTSPEPTPTTTSPEPTPTLPVIEAPPVASDSPSDAFADSAFLYTGENAPQQGMAAGTVTPARVAVLHGWVTARGGAPLGGVTVTVDGHSEFGHTTSTAKGEVALVVNGGGELLLRYERDGYLPVDRLVTPDQRDYAALPDVTMVPLDTAVTEITGGSEDTQVVRGSAVTDSDGTRQATLIVPGGTEATMTLPDGSEQALSAMHVRATEYTVGESGPEAMPGELPPASGYTYAVDYTVDEAMAAGATRVDFDQPIAAYTDNFLGFPVGTPVPVGYYDAGRHAWVASPDGRVVGVTAVSGGKAELDVDGDGAADGAEQLAALGITDDERSRLASLYTPGASLWRVQVRHFTPWDCNWPYGPPPGASPPQLLVPGIRPSKCEQSGSIIGCEGQTLGEELGVPGTPFTLRYDTGREPGYRNQLQVPLVDGAPPSDLIRIDLRVEVAGRSFTGSFAPTADLLRSFVWDGTDAFGRRLPGAQTARVDVGYVYPATYYAARSEFEASFGQAGSAPLSVDRTGLEITMHQNWATLLGSLGGDGAQGIGGWTLSDHHAYDRDQHMLLLGDGTWRSAADLDPTIATVAGDGSAGTGQGTYTGDGGPASEAGLGVLGGVTVAPDGSVFLVDTAHGVVRRIAPDGVITTVAGGGTPDDGIGDGGPATEAALDAPMDVAVTRDGSLLISDAGSDTVRRVAPGGTITTVAGGASDDALGDGGAATDAALIDPHGVAVGMAGEYYVVDSGHDRVRRVGPDGVITTVAGGGSPADGLGDGRAGPDAALDFPTDVVVAHDGQVYIADTDHNRVRLLTRDGSIRTVAGDGVYGNSDDGKPALDAHLGDPVGLALEEGSGSLLVVQRLFNQVRRVGGDGVLTTVTGNDGWPTYYNDGGPATLANLNHPQAAALAPDGALYIADSGNFRLRRVAAAMPGFGLGEVAVPSSDGTEVYRFDRAGRHLSTLDALTGATLLQFLYDDAGRLAAIEDGYRNQTVIERAPDGTPTAVIAPFGQRTELTVNNGRLTSVTDPAQEKVSLTYGPGGLLSSFTDPQGQTSHFTYDGSGRLVRDDGPGGRSTALARTEHATSSEVTATTTEGRTSVYRTELLPDRTVRTTTVASDGSRSVRLTAVDGTITATDPDGTVTTTTMGSDPRWGTQVRMPASVTVRTPSGSISTATMRRGVSMRDGGLSSQSDTVTLNNRASSYTQYDGPTRTLRMSTPTGRAVVATLDAHGRTARVQDGTLAAVSYAYDDRGRLVSATEGSGESARVTTYGYGLDGYVNRVTGPLVSVDFVRDPMGRTVRTLLPDGNRVGYAYDGDGDLIGVTPPGRGEHGYGYTDGKLPARYSPPPTDAGADPSTRYAYNRDGAPVSVTLPGGPVVEFGYDDKGRPSTVTGGADRVQFDWNDVTGGLRSISTAAGQKQALSYDGNLLRAVATTGASAGTVSYTYDANQRVQGRSVNGGAAVSYAYDTDGTVTSAGGESLTWDRATGRLTATGVGVVGTGHGYDQFGTPTAFSAMVSGATQLADTYTLDALGRITSRTETADGAAHTTGYAYDSLGRVTDVTSDGATVEHYAYDANGNRVAATTGAGTVTATYDGQDRMLSYGDTTYRYSADGKLTTSTAAGVTTTYTYDGLGRLVTVERAGGPRIDYVLDALGRRVAKKRDGVVVERWLYGATAEPVAALDAAGNVTATYVYGSRGHVPDLVRTGGRTYRIVTDRLGSPRLVVDTASGAVAQRLDYDTFGAVTRDTNPGFQPFGFAGGRYDPDTGLTRFGARDYDPVTGRFTTKDPLLLGGGLNVYAYVGGDPVNRIDPDGTSWYDPAVDWFKGDLKRTGDILRPIGAALRDAGAGAADAMTFGGSTAVLRGVGLDQYVNHCSGWYTGGEVLGTVAPLLLTDGMWGAGGAARSEEGIYYFMSSDGRYYVGQSGEKTGRFMAHLKTGKLAPEGIDTLKFIPVTGGKTARETAEQLLINDLGGKGPLRNGRNPTGGRPYLTEGYNLDTFLNLFGG